MYRDKNGLTRGQIVPYIERMKIDLDKWSIIDALAESEGVPKETRKKWRHRGVPAVWQIKFVKARPGALSFDDFGTSVLIPRTPSAEGQGA